MATKLEYLGLSVSQWAQLTGLKESTIRTKIKAGKPLLKNHEELVYLEGEPVILDKDFVEIITTLNNKGYKTRACCSGHLNQPNSFPYIVFEAETAPSFEMLDKTFIWAIQQQYDKGELSSVTIYFNDILSLAEANGSLTKQQQEQYLKDLHAIIISWVDKLPSIKKEPNMRTYNVSKDKVNYSQRNNEVNPSKSCNTTSMTMAASYLPEIWKLFTESPIYKKYAKKFKQPEDCLQQYMLDSGLRPTYHEDLSKAFNDFVGKKVTKFSMSVSIAKLVNELKAGRPVVISGDFPKPDGKTLGHIVCLVGCIFNNDNKTNVPDFWIIDDPYGDTMNNWQGSGNDIKLTHEYFMKNIKEKGKGSKWGHLFLV